MQSNTCNDSAKCHWKYRNFVQHCHVCTTDLTAAIWPLVAHIMVGLEPRKHLFLLGKKSLNFTAGRPLADTGSLFLLRLRRAVSASRHHASVTALHFSPRLTKHTREGERKKRKKTEQTGKERCLAFNLSLSAVKNEWALSLLAGRKNRTVIVISQQAPELAHLLTPTNTHPSLLSLSLSFLIFLIHPHFLCCESV